MNGVAVRPACETDAEGINAVYNPFIRNSASTFETEELTRAERRQWLVERAADSRYPVVVAQTGDGVVCGFANASPFDKREGYRTSIKTSVFVTPDWQGKGLARKLYTALFEALAGEGLHRAYALIVAPNPASVALHEAFGFAYLATLDEAGWKFDRYHDVLWFEKRL